MTEEKGVVGKATGSEDPAALVEMVLRQSYLETTEDLRAHAEKVRKLNKSKKALRDLQNVLQKQQQTLQMMSNISQMLHETAIAVIRKMGG